VLGVAPPHTALGGLGRRGRRGHPRPQPPQELLGAGAPTGSRVVIAVIPESPDTGVNVAMDTNMRMFFVSPQYCG